ncbi:MAG TPA: type IV toxin-antitoxin system AbiEi family antitoxin [Cyclobacteriaceae bacterium]
MKENDIVEKALEAFISQTHLKAKWRVTPNEILDGAVDFYLDKKKKECFLVEVKKEIRNHHLPKLLAERNRGTHLMVIAETVLPRVKEELQKNNIGYLETNGNVYLHISPNFFIWIDRKKTKLTVKEVNRAFTKTGLRVVFLFLQDNLYVNRPYRELAQLADVGLGNVNNIMKGLKTQRLLVHKNAREYVLPDKKVLLEKWIEAYDERLKPTLHVGNFRFLDNDVFFNWRNLNLAPDTLWGGEPAGDLYTNNLNPELLTLYTLEGRGELMKKYRLVPDEKGNVQIYKKFWNVIHSENDKAVPALLAYTDLINTGNRRCIDTAQKLYEKFLKNKFE